MDSADATPGTEQAPYVNNDQPVPGKSYFTSTNRFVPAGPGRAYRPARIITREEAKALAASGPKLVLHNFPKEIPPALLRFIVEEELRLFGRLIEDRETMRLFWKILFGVAKESDVDLWYSQKYGAEVAGVSAPEEPTDSRSPQTPAPTPDALQPKAPPVARPKRARGRQH